MTPWIRDWVDALESGYFKQGPNPVNLWDLQGRYSALGVLCEINGCKREAIDLVSVREEVRERMLKYGTSSIDDVESRLDTFMYDRSKCDTAYYYTYKGDRRINEHLYYIPISLTSKLDCNACLQLLNGASRNIAIGIEGRQKELSVAALSNALVPFAVIAEFICDVWPALTFKQSKKFTVDYKDYGYFKLERA